MIQSLTFYSFGSGIVESFEATAKYNLLYSLKHAYWKNANKGDKKNIVGNTIYPHVERLVGP